MPGVKLVTLTTIFLINVCLSTVVLSGEKVSDSVKERSIGNVENLKSLEDYSVESNVKDSREGKEYAYDGWRAVEAHSEGVSGWIPHDSQEQAPKRRRIKKRKRRPPTPAVSLTSEETSQATEEVVLTPRRRVRPQRLDQMPEPWQEMSDEQSRPYIRRRLTPTYRPSDDIVTSKEEINIESLEQTIRFPDDDSSEENKNTDTRKDEIKRKSSDIITSTETTSKLPDLKTILKNRGGLSLSEILQQKNLSLSELLSGNQKAISALTERPSYYVKSTTEIATEITKYKRLPPSVGLRKNINRNYEQDVESIETVSSRETLEAQRKRLALLQSHKDSKIYFEVPKFEVVTEPTTEKRIFVPSHPKLYTSVDYKPADFLFPDQTTELSPELVEHNTENVMTTQSSTSTTTFKPQEKMYNNGNNKIYNRMFLKPKLKVNFPTSAIPKLKKFTNKIIFKDEESLPEQSNFPRETTLPPNAIKISVKDILGYLENQNEDKATDGPLRMSIDLENIVEETTKSKHPPKLFNFKHSTTSRQFISMITTTTEAPATSEATTTKLIPEKIQPFTAKDEIMEILKDPVGRENLSRILNLRNMTIQELVELRERGSSQLHLADIFHNKTKEPEPKDEPFIGQVSSEYFNNFPVFTSRRRQKSIFTGEITQKPEGVKIEEPVKSPQNLEIVTVTSFPTFKIELNKELNEKTQQQTFPWKQLYPDFFDNQGNNNAKTVEPILSEEDIQRLDEVESQLSSVSNEKLNVEETVAQEDEVFISLPTGVKSAILASLAIVGLSLLVFLTILFIFKWMQKHRQKLNYCNSLSSKIKAPILEVGHRNIKTFVAETLGKKKNYYKSHLQSMSDNIWQNDRSPSY